MLPQKTNDQANELLRRLSTHGWKVVEIEQPFEDEWWVAEFWVIEAASSHQRTRVWLTFLVDPMEARGDIWAVYASKERPHQPPLDHNPLMSLGHGWQNVLPGFIGTLDQCREELPHA
jgi:hypothetical protein